MLFVDIVGFTQYSADKDPQEVIGTLRDFHGRMEHEVFAHQGTLDKYLGDGLMATFGTPTPSEQDASSALDCAFAMMASVDKWNRTRREAGHPEIRASFGLHYGPTVLGDIGASRLEFAVLGNTVNVASRLEALTRQLGVELIASDDLVVRVGDERGGRSDRLPDLTRREGQQIRGLDKPITVWTAGVRPAVSRT